MKKTILFLSASLFLISSSTSPPGANTAKPEIHIGAPVIAAKSAATTSPKPAASQPAASKSQNLIFNGSFENSIDPGGGWQHYDAGATAIYGWIVTFGEIDLWGGIKTPFGKKTIDLDGQQAGGVMQVVATEPGATYRLKFWVGSYDSDSKTVFARAAGDRQNWPISVQGSTQQPWLREVSFDFKARNKQTEVEIGSATQGSQGPVIDNVSCYKIADPVSNPVVVQPAAQTATATIAPPPAKEPAPPPEPPMDPATAKKLTDEKVSAIYKQIQDLVKQFYPRAQIKTSDTGLHFEYKVKSEIGYYSNRPVQAPQEGGILGDVSCEAGAYKEKFEAEKRDGFHTILTLAPYSKQLDHHVFATLTFPTDVPNEFKEQFTDSVNSFAK